MGCRGSGPGGRSAGGSFAATKVFVSFCLQKERGKIIYLSIQVKLRIVFDLAGALFFTEISLSEGSVRND